MQHPARLALFASLCFLALLAGMAWHHSQLQSLADRLAALEPTSAPAATPTTPRDRTAPATGNAAADISDLRQQLAELRDLISSRIPPTHVATAESANPAAAAGTPGSIVDADERAHLKAVLSELLAERDASRMVNLALDANPVMMDHQQMVLNDLEGRLRLSAFQKEQIGKLLDERRQANRLTAGLPPNPEEMMKRMQEADADLDRKVREFLTPQQVTEYEQWRDETGGWSPMQVMVFTSGDRAIGGSSVNIKVTGPGVPVPGK